jgi:hypothetical protein
MLIAISGMTEGKKIIHGRITPDIVVDSYLRGRRTP